MQQRIRLVGGREALEAVTAELEKQIAEEHGDISLDEPRPVHASLGARAPYGQVELFDVMVTIAINLASSALYDLVKTAIVRAQPKGSAEIHVDIHFVDDTRQETTDPR